MLTSTKSTEMQKLQKVNIRLEKNAEEWKLKHHKCQQQLIALTESSVWGRHLYFLIFVVKF